MNKVTPAELWLTIAPEWIQNLPAWLEDILFKGYKCFIYGDRYMLFLKGLKNTLILTFFALLIGIRLIYKRLRGKKPSPSLLIALSAGLGILLWSF